MTTVFTGDFTADQYIEKRTKECVDENDRQVRDMILRTQNCPNMSLFFFVLVGGDSAFLKLNRVSMTLGFLRFGLQRVIIFSRRLRTATAHISCPQTC